LTAPQRVFQYVWVVDECPERLAMPEIDTISKGLKAFQIRALGNVARSERLATFLDPDETILGMVKAENIKVDSKNMKHSGSRGFLLLVLSQHRLIVGTQRIRIVGTSRHFAVVRSKGRTVWLDL
jgi:hypothetical protein